MAHTPQTLAQQQPANQPAQEPTPQQGAPQQAAPAQPDGADIDEGESKPVEGSNLVIDPQMQPGDRPTPPQSETMQDLRDREETPVITGAGVGSEVAYASQGVVELGGVLALTHASQTTTIRIAPSVGYFFIDNLELTLFPELSILHISGGDNDDGSTDVVVGGTLEPSYHLPFSDRIFGFAGIGLGVRYADDPGVDVFLRPRFGIDVMVGRSGIFKPALFADIGANDGLSSGGFEAAFTVML
jgi:hypothetical protein